MQHIKYIFFGIIAALGALVVEMVLSVLFPNETAVLVNQITFLLLLLVATEELFKFSVINKTVSASSFFWPSFFISAGFALTEIILAYAKNMGTAQNTFYLLLTGVGTIHLATGIICGYAALSRRKTNRILPALTLLFLAIVLHLIYNVAIIKLIKN